MKTLFRACLLLLLLASMISPVVKDFYYPSPVKADTWLTGWSYRKSISINGSSSGNQTNYQMKLSVSHNDTIPFYDVSLPWVTITGDPSNAHTFQPVHNSRIQELNYTINGTAYKYIAYDCDADGDNINLFYTDNIDGSWTSYPANPILSGVQTYRSPSVTYIDGVFHMILEDRANTLIKRYTSADGISYSSNETIVNVGEWSDPFLWQNPNDSLWYLYWAKYGAEPYSLYVRKSANIADLDSATSELIMTDTEAAPGWVARPCVFYKDGFYWLTTEKQNAANMWVSDAYHSTSANTSFVYSGRMNTITPSNGMACPMVFLMPDSDKTYIFTVEASAVNWYLKTREVYSRNYISTEGNSNSDFSDIRFTNSAGDELDYFRESYSSDNISTFWVEVDSIPTATITTIYIYYGNAAAATTSNALNAMSFYDDFLEPSDSVNWTYWQSTDHSKYTVAAGILKASIPSATTKILNTASTYSGFSVTALMQVPSDGYQGYLSSEPSAASFTGEDGTIIDWGVGNSYTTTINNSAFNNSFTPNATAWHYCTLNIPASGTASAVIERDDGNHNTLASYKTGTPHSTTGYVSILAYGSAGSYTNVDWVRIRKYTNPEPQFSSFGSEETESGNSPPVLDAIGAKSVDEGSLLSFTINATDPDGDPMTYTASNLPSGASFNGTTKTFTWTPDYTQSGVYPNVHFEVSDNNSLTDSENITITVNNTVLPPDAPTGLTASDGTSTANVSLTWNPVTEALGYYVFRDGDLLADAGNVTSYVDSSAAAPIIVAGAAVASDGTSNTTITVSLSGASVIDGTTYSYTIKAYNASGNSTASAANTGYRGHGVHTIQLWGGASSSGLSSIAGATSSPYSWVLGTSNTTRYLQWVETATGAASQNSTQDTGYTADAPVTTSSTIFTGVIPILGVVPLLVLLGFVVVVLYLFAVDVRSYGFGYMLSMEGLIGFSLLILFIGLFFILFNVLLDAVEINL